MTPTCFLYMITCKSSLCLSSSSDISRDAVLLGNLFFHIPCNLWNFVHCAFCIGCVLHKPLCDLMQADSRAAPLQDVFYRIPCFNRSKHETSPPRRGPPLHGFELHLRSAAGTRPSAAFWRCQSGLPSFFPTKRNCEIKIGSSMDWCSVLGTWKTSPWWGGPWVSPVWSP